MQMREVKAAVDALASTFEAFKAANDEVKALRKVAALAKGIITGADNGLDEYWVTSHEGFKMLEKWACAVMGAARRTPATDTTGATATATPTPTPNPDA